ncbi:MAG: DUF3467 domain-containing protein [Steroidobacteraceae bacterium]
MATVPEIDPQIFKTAPVNRRAPDHKTVYSNVIRTGITPFDIRIVFGQVAEPIPGTPAQQVEELATVIISPEEAKAMIPFLEQAVQVYEEQYGQIRDVTSRLETMKAAALAKAKGPAKAEASAKSKKS